MIISGQMKYCSCLEMAQHRAKWTEICGVRDTTTNIYTVVCILHPFILRPR